MKRKSIIAFTVIALISLTYITNESRVTDVLAKSENFYSKIKIFTSILETIHRAYVEPKDPDELIEDAVKGVLANLDPHTYIYRQMISRVGTGVLKVTRALASVSKFSRTMSLLSL